jgi:hypothetical protein
MLFLVNAAVLDVGDPFTTFARLRPGVRASLANGISAGRKLAFERGSPEAGPFDEILAVAAEIASVSCANAALFVRPARAADPRQVVVRLAEAPITTLAYLLQQQNLAGVSVGNANAYVWRHSVAA